MSGICAAIALLLSSLTNVYLDPALDDNYPFQLHHDLRFQAAFTILSMVTTLIIAIFGGGVTGWLMVLLPFPNYEFIDTDNFNNVILKTYDNVEHEQDPFRNTIRGKWFGNKYQKLAQNNSQEMMNRKDKIMTDQDTLRNQNYHWNDDHYTHGIGEPAGIQVVDTIINGMGVDNTDWR